MTIFITFLAILLTFFLIIGVHEFGHALAAHWFKVKIERVGFGFGKPIFCWQNKKGTYFCINRWPLGGYVKLLNSRIDKVNDSDKPYCLDNQSLFARGIIYLSGGLMNFIFAFVALLFFFLLGFPSQLPVVEKISPNSIMAKAGLQKGDQLMKIANQSSANWADVGMILATHTGEKNVPFEVTNPSKGQRFLTADLSLLSWQSNLTFIEQFGIIADKSQIYAIQVPGTSLAQTISKTLEKMGSLLLFFLLTIKQLILGRLPFSLLLGPIGILALSIKTFIQGFSLYLHFIATLSLAIGLINLLPFPGLDGGALVYLLIEKIRGKPLSIPLEVLLYRLAFIAFVVFFVQLLLNDFHHWLIKAP